MQITVANQDSATKLSDAALPRAPLWALAGPTGVGKSDLAMALGRATGAEILSCDSVQCYRRFDIGSAKPSAQDRAEVSHHLLDWADATDPAGLVDAHTWAQAARAAEAEVRGRNRRPFVCGGTGLYLRALREGLVPVPTDAALRAMWGAREDAQPGAVYTELCARDPQSARRIGPHNKARLLRALEMVLSTGDTVASLWARHVRAPLPMRIVALNARREWLLPRLRARTRSMLQQGLLDEARALLKAGVHEAAPPLRAVGYREAVACVRGELCASALEDTIVVRTWQYARRQRTWLRREPHVLWLDAEALSTEPPAAKVATLLQAFARPDDNF